MTHTSVSYTHLDVYKRQGMEMFGVSKYISVPVAALGVWLLVVGGSYTVSYTHLDVYKRQVLPCLFGEPCTDDGQLRQKRLGRGGEVVGERHICLLYTSFPALLVRQLAHGARRQLRGGRRLGRTALCAAAPGGGVGRLRCV